MQSFRLPKTQNRTRMRRQAINHQVYRKSPSFETVTKKRDWIYLPRDDGSTQVNLRSNRVSLLPQQISSSVDSSKEKKRANIKNEGSSSSAEFQIVQQKKSKSNPRRAPFEASKSILEGDR